MPIVSPTSHPTPPLHPSFIPPDSPLLSLWAGRFLDPSSQLGMPSVAPSLTPSYWDSCQDWEKDMGRHCILRQVCTPSTTIKLKQNGFQGASVNIGFCFVHLSRAMLVRYSKVFITLCTVPCEIGSYHPV